MFSRLAKILFVPLLISCNDTLSPTGNSNTDEIAGTYSVTVFLVTQSGETIDITSAGGALQLIVSPVGTVSGQLSIPGGVFEDPQGVSTAFSGTWTRDADSIFLDLREDLFLRDMTFVLVGDSSPFSLQGHGTFNNVEVTIVLIQNV